MQPSVHSVCVNCGWAFCHGGKCCTWSYRKRCLFYLRLLFVLALTSFASTCCAKLLLCTVRVFILHRMRISVKSEIQTCVNCDGWNARKYCCVSLSRGSYLSKIIDWGFFFLHGEFREINSVSIICFVVKT